VVPRLHDGLHPLCAVYAASALVTLRRRLEAGRYKLTDALADLRVREVGPEEMAPVDPGHLSLFNINTAGDLARANALASGAPRGGEARDQEPDRPV
jgi:molybdopterin-guanine dinucleotide biosynthesis protein A